MKKLTQYYYIVLLIVFFMLPVPFWKAAGEKIFDTTNYEKRELAVSPGVPASVSEYEAFPGNFEDFFNDHLPFRNQILTAGGLIDYYGFKSSLSSNVLVGKDGWLFYKGRQQNNENPTSDYFGKNLFAPQELEWMAERLEAAKAACEAEGRQFIVVLPPSKEHVYSQYMPAGYGAPAGETRLSQVTAYLEQNTDVTIIHPYEEMQQYADEHPDERIYFKYDTHWNNAGAYIAARQLNYAIGVQNLPPLSEVGRAFGEEQPDDLARLLHLSKYLQDDPQLFLQNYSDTLNIVIEGNDDRTEFYYTNYSPVDQRKIYIVCDSFTMLMAQYVVPDFAHVIANYYYHYQPEDLEAENPDIVVYEVAERYLANIMTFSLDGN